MLWGFFFLTSYHGDIIFSRFISSCVQLICILLFLCSCFVKNKNRDLNVKRILLGFVAVTMDYIFIKPTTTLNLL